jgi:hypothetical protein
VDIEIFYFNGIPSKSKRVLEGVSLSSEWASLRKFPRLLFCLIVKADSLEYCEGELVTNVIFLLTRIFFASLLLKNFSSTTKLTTNASQLKMKTSPQDRATR